jgi:hypothetical protein
MKIKNKKRAIIIGVIAASVVIAGVVLAWYFSYVWQPKIKPYEINTSDASAHILIAAQGKDYKKDTLEVIANHYAGKDVFISVIDISGLSDVNVEKWDYLVLFSAIQMYELDPDVQEFLNHVGEDERILLYNTSGGSQIGFGNIDAITSASINPEHSAEVIIQRIDKAIANK